MESATNVIASRELLEETNAYDINLSQTLNEALAVEVDGETVSITVPELSFVPRPFLREPVGSGNAERGRIVAALDILFTGI